MLTVPVPQDLYLKTRSVSSVSSANLERTRLIKKVRRDRKFSEPPILHKKYRYFDQYALLYFFLNFWLITVFINFAQLLFNNYFWIKGKIKSLSDNFFISLIF